MQWLPHLAQQLPLPNRKAPLRNPKQNQPKRGVSVRRSRRYLLICRHRAIHSLSRCEYTMSFKTGDEAYLSITLRSFVVGVWAKCHNPNLTPLAGILGIYDERVGSKNYSLPILKLSVEWYSIDRLLLLKSHGVNSLIKYNYTNGKSLIKRKGSL